MMVPTNNPPHLFLKPSKGPSFFSFIKISASVTLKHLPPGVLEIEKSQATQP